MRRRQVLQAEATSLSDEIERRVAEGEPVRMGDRSFVWRVRRLVDDPPRDRRTWVQAVRIGDLGIAGVPGECFVELGLDIKARSPFDQTMLIKLANDSMGYIPTQRACEEGACEAESSPYVPGLGEEIADAAVGLPSELHART